MHVLLGQQAAITSIEVKVMSVTADILEPVVCSGTPEEIGTAFGSINAEMIRRHVADFMDTCIEHGLDEAKVVEKSARGLDIMRLLAPWWEAELNALAEAADIRPDVYKAFSIGKYRSLFFGAPECTSYAATGASIPFAGTTFHKSRDNVSRLQCAFVRGVKTESDNPYRWVGTSDTSDATTMMFVNEHGLAGSADTGGQAPTFYGNGLMNTFCLRYFAETCMTCQDVAKALVEWCEKRYYAGGRIITNWMFADATGTILRAVQNNDEVELQFTQDGVVINCYREKLESDLKRQTGYLDAWALTEASRLNSVSMPSTISSLSVDCKIENPEHLTCAWMSLGQPKRAPYVPIFVASRTTPRALVDGRLYQRSMPSRTRLKELRKMEKGFREKAEDCIARAKRMVARGETNGIARMTEQVTAECVREVFDTMTGDA